MRRFISFILKLSFICILAAVFFGTGVFVHAQSNSDQFGLQPVANTIAISTQQTDLRVTIVRVINIFLGFLGVVAFAIILYAGYIWMTSGGNEEQVAVAKKLLINAVIGLVIIMSAFAISSFILRSLQGSINGGEGGGGEGDPGIQGSCSEPGSPYYELYHNTSRCTGFCNLYPLQCCTAENFVVKSITPHTPGANEQTGMNNEVIRVLFSKRVAGSATDVFKIYQKQNGQNVDISNSFNFAFVEDGSLVEATYSGGSVPNGEYTVEVNEGIRDISGKVLTTDTSCGTFSRIASFKTGDLGNAPVIDDSFGGLDHISLNGNAGDDIYSIVQGREYPIATTLRDDRGNGYAYIRIYKEGDVNSVLEHYIDGPRVTLGSSKAFELTYGFRVTSKFTPGTVYVAEVIAHDIDGNIRTSSVRFKTVPATCQNGVLDSGEGPEADQGGVCGGSEGNSCTSSSDCGNGLQCLDSHNNTCAGAGVCSCVAVPYISDVQYMNGAEGNWITILGKNFGSVPGVVKFNYDFNGDSAIDSSVTASLAQCRVGSVWNNSWIIAEVPKEIEGATVSPSISVKNTQLGGSSENNDFLDVASLANGNVLDMHFEESHGGTVGDDSVKNNNGVTGGSIQYGAEGRVGKSFAFDVDGDLPGTPPGQAGGVSVSASQNSSLALQQGSVFAWIKKDTSAIYYDGIVVNQGHYGMFIDDRNNFAVYDWNGEGADNWVSSGVNVSDGRWHHVGFTFSSGVANGTKLYIDGVMVKSDKITVAPGGGVLTIGSGVSDLSSQFFRGAIDEVAVWNKVLSEGDVRSLYGTYVNQKFTDFTNDNFGPDVGLFTYNTIYRPSLCSATVSVSRELTLDDGTTVTIPKGSVFGPQGTNVVLEGKGFGAQNGSVFFGQSSASISSWSTDIINSAVPFGSEGTVSVSVTSQNNEKSNPVPFTISSIANLHTPVITSIDPTPVTKGSYITIAGTNFGSEGTVYFSLTEGNSCPGAGCILAAELPGSCGDTWTDTQIISRIPTDSEFELGKYFVIVSRRDLVNTFSSLGKESVDVVAGGARPSICRIDPRRGFAPLSGGEALSIYGENFLSNSQVKFWFPLGDAQNPESWLSSSVGVTVGGASIIRATSEKIETQIPYDIHSGFSMSSGPVKVKNAAGLFSNAIAYEVRDCRESGATALPGFQCCTEGPDAGRWKQGNFACEGGSREAGYVWRFTTGKTPQKFFVAESCTASDMASPSPSTLWVSGKNVCINAQLQVKFNLPFNPSSISTNQGDPKNIAVVTCGGTDSAIDCSSSSVVTDQFSVLQIGNDAFALKKKNGETLSPKTWYRVALSSDVSSLLTQTELGVSVEKSSPLEKTRGCDTNNDGVNDAAYCFDFRTGDSEFLCSLAGANLNPPVHTTNLLGVVQDSRYSLVYDLGNLFNADQVKPLSYVVTGRANQECVAINVDDKNWQWGGVQPSIATATKYPGQGYVNARGYATAFENHSQGSDVYAVVDQIKATSTLIIDLGNPYAKSVWPSCLEACVNAEIGVEFSQLMNRGDFNASNITLRKCSNENCTQLGSPISLDIKSESQSDSFLRAYPSAPLEKNSWYLVDMGSGIRSVGAITSAGPPPVVKFGSSATAKQWKFKTKDSSQLCLADSVTIQPDPFYSTFIGQAQLYKAFPVGSPDSCSPHGQQLNPWNFGWNWSAGDTQVAEVSNFSFSGSPKSTCTIGCTPAGSDISKNQNSQYAGGYPVCGNGVKDSGEDCDIAMSGETPGTSCTFACLRPGNSSKGTGSLQCGNGIIDKTVGEECDPAQSGAIPGFCSDVCVNKGSSTDQTGDPTIPVCGSGAITYGEDCDITDPSSKNNCSNRCINLGTSVSQAWCDTQTGNSGFASVCQSAVSVCGNGKIEQGEECDDSSNYCSESCLVVNACDDTSGKYKQCALGSEGCLSDCTLAGSSITYSVPSVCGDGSTRGSANSIGEYYGSGETDIRSCEVAPGQAQNSLGGNPVQVVTSIGGTRGGQSVEIVSDMKTDIKAGTATAFSGSATPVSIGEVTGIGEYHLKCGYTEYAVPQSDGSYNNCPVNSDNGFGVGLNSCCVKRPERISQYPLPNAGVGSGTAPICRNTYIEVTFDQNIPNEYLQNNIKLVQSYPQGYSCSTHGGEDVTVAVNTLLDIHADTPRSLWVRVWDSVKSFFARMIRIAVFAETSPNVALPTNVTWCTSNISLDLKATYRTNTAGVITATDVSVYPTKALESNSYVVVLLNGGKDGIRNQTGVSIKSPFGTELSDYWVFKTNTQICKVKEVSVTPLQSLFTIPNSSKDFIATAVSTFEDQLIVSIPGEYEWSWSWGPQNDNIFAIPAVTTPQNTITSKGVRGHTDGVVRAEITKDVFPDNNQQGKLFSSVFSLDAFFCQRPWPASGVTLSQNVASTTFLFKDPKYNFSMYYCADSGSALSQADDLPYFNIIDVVTDPEDLGVISSSDLPDALRRYLMFADKTDDAIGVQIFANVIKSDGTRRTLEDWYTEKFGNISAVKKSSVGGFDALVNDSNVYVNAFNVDGGTVYNNIYLFSIDVNASAQTRTVFEALINSLAFNTNLTNFGRCLKTGTGITVRDTPTQFGDISCTTDFDCRESSGAPKSGTNGTCSNAKTKFERDITRLEQMYTTGQKTNAQSSNTQLNFSSGSYIPGYTNSKWPSWGKLGSIIGGAPIDPVNRWTGCDGQDPSTCWSVVSTTFKCPVFAQTYEYSYDNSIHSYRYYVPFEFMRPTDSNFVSQYIDSNHISFNRWCTPESVITPFGGQCGDGNINIGEECDPPGRSVLMSTNASGQACLIGSYVTATCNSSCHYSYSACTAQAQTCGNGSQEGTEECDGGSQNGQYGSQCTVNCKLATAVTGGQFCGNGTLDKNAQGKNLEFCEEVNGACLHIDNTGQVLKSTVHIVLDRSGSMTTGVPGTGKTRWANAVDGLKTIYTSLLSNVNFSLSIFSSSTSECYRDMGKVTAANSNSILNGISPTGQTPTRCALQQVLSKKDSIFGSSDTIPKKLILITDGTPSDATDQETADVIRQLNDNHISTYVVGFSSVPTTTLNLFAEAGGTANPLSSDKFFKAEKSSEFVTAFTQILGCFEYSQYKQSSCSWNCQEYGEYCGDGTIQSQNGEECDLGGQNGGSSCSNYCKRVIATPGAAVCGNRTVESGEQCDDGNTVGSDGCSSTCTTEISIARCGNGPQGGANQPALDPGEQCDLGSQNGVVCTPGYGASCTYCSNSCLNVIVDPVAYCGNGKVDSAAQRSAIGTIVYSQLEKCETASASTTYTLQNGGLNLPPIQQELRCSDKGSYTCTNSCQTSENHCVSCGVAEALPVPKISILNPMTEAGQSPYTTTVGYVDLLRKNPPGSTTTTLQWLGYKKINYRSEDPNSYIDPFEPYFLLINAQFQPVTTQGIQTNNACNGEYALLFNKNHISALKTGTITGLSNVQVVGQGLADLFDYSVNGEGGTVTNEVVMSPAVYSNQLRIVTRWKKKNGLSSAIFMGELYQDKMAQSADQSGNTYSYFNNVGVTDLAGRPIEDYNCGKVMKDPSNYYVATNCNDATKQLIMHKILNPASTLTSVQAVTISTALGSVNPIAFYVTSPNGPINQLKDYELWVDVYTYHAGQIPDLSIYKPTYSFSIKDAIPSTNSIARYWHVFNLIFTGTPGAIYPQGLGNRQFTIQPVGTNGAIVTDQCAVRKNMPLTTQCPTQ